MMCIIRLSKIARRAPGVNMEQNIQPPHSGSLPSNHHNSSPRLCQLVAQGAQCLREVRYNVSCAEWCLISLMGLRDWLFISPHSVRFGVAAPLGTYLDPVRVETNPAVFSSAVRACASAVSALLRAFFPFARRKMPSTVLLVK